METSALQQLLKSFCNNSYWIYAVFWKIKHQTAPVLAWEDGYCNYQKSAEDRLIKERDEHVSSYYGTNIHNGDSGNCSIGPAVADMACLQYALGEGTVGSVASSGNHSWIFLENVFASDVFSASIYEGPSEWLIQYASGIETILLVPVLPFGVLQLGSLQTVSENLSVVAYIKEKFSPIHFVDGNATIFSSDKSVWPPLCVSVFSNSVFDILNEQTNPTNTLLELENHGATDDVKPPLSTSNSFSVTQDVLTVSRRIRPATFHSGKEHKCDMQVDNLEELFAPLYQTIRASDVEFSDLFSLESLLPAPTQLRNHETGFFERNLHNVHSYSANNVFVHDLATKKEYDTADNFFSFRDDCELHEALGPGFLAQKQSDEFSNDSSGSIKDTTSSRDFNDGDIEHLLEAVITAYDNSDFTFANSTVNARVTPVVGKSSLSAENCSQSESRATVVDDPAPWIFPEPTVTDIGRKKLTSLSTSNSIVVNKWEENDHGITRHTKGMKSSHSSRRTKETSNPRQRPRDRQLIQDRIKELRQIVPNGAKCSIDGLLERTIKHMLYLQRVTDQAEKLKQLAAQHEGSDSENHTALNNEDYRQNRASWTWAFDIGSDPQVCPIVVEDLEFQGHMLIKMLCNDMGLFLEIAQIIRNLEITILKGVIERHSNNSWAHFIVEAPRGFHRMDIFWPLMHLLQRKRNPISSRI